ncbi:hypothetical protein EJB05_37807 [Eragrostis curvula]|uniref:WEB family protein n=1 Tax=Eragrostis curvula TaxID=38414 RepID=A0A5J9TSL9_9POAL|nr:hypothetical protein EJB05_37807 [Eragrostis curvula]
MLSARPRSGSFEAGLRGGASTTAASSVSKLSPRLQRSRSSAGGSSKASPSPERRRVGVGGAMQQRVAQLEEELGREREEKARALRELDDLRKDGENVAKGGTEKVQHLEREVEKSKESERKMLESLIYQTKQLEQTKISLEEAKLEIAALQQANKGLEAASFRRGGVEQRSVKDLVFGGADEEIRVLRAELRAATQGEERSRKAVDDLSVALSDVTMEAKQVKLWLAEVQAELEAANAEAGRLRGDLAASESRVREHDRRRAEAEEAAAAWADKERVLLDCVRASEEEVNRARQDNTKLVESQRVIRDENARLRDILKQAVAEANAVKDSLELARAENARLGDAVATRTPRCRASARSTSASSTPASSAKTAPAPDYDHHLLSTNGGSAAASRNGTPKVASRRWLPEKPRTPGSRRFSLGEPDKFKGAFSQSARMGNMDPKERVFASLSNIADLKSAADAAMDDFDDEFDHIDESHYTDMDSSMSHKKKRPIFRKFGDLFRRKSFYKANLAPVHT